MYKYGETIIRLKPQMNEHQLYLGKSGSGKSWALCREIEEQVKKGRKIIVVDYSGSFTAQELKRQHLNVAIQTINPENQTINLPITMQAKNIEQKLVTFLCEMFELFGYNQRALVGRAVKMSMESKKNPNLRNLRDVFEKIYNLTDDDIDQKRCVEKILSRMEGVCTGNYLDLCLPFKNKSDSVLIYQVSFLPESVRRPIVRGILWALWELKKEGEILFDTLVLDELQNLQITSNTLSAIMREGRKFGIQLLLSTQFLQGMLPDAIRNILQAETQLLFCPVEADIKLLAAQLSADCASAWRKKLRDLKRGEAVLCGSYTVNENQTVLNQPIIVRIDYNRVHKQKKIRRFQTKEKANL